MLDKIIYPVYIPFLINTKKKWQSLIKSYRYIKSSLQFQSSNSAISYICKPIQSNIYDVHKFTCCRFLINWNIMHTWYNIYMPICTLWFITFESSNDNSYLIQECQSINCLISKFTCKRCIFCNIFTCIKNLLNFCCFKRKVFVSFNFKVCENVTFDNDYVYHFM